jgi:hypothetical protein
MRDLFDQFSGAGRERGGKARLVDLTMTAHGHSALAYRLSLDGDDQHSVWLPRAAVELDPPDDPPIKGRHYTATMPERLALNKGLI